jgi:transcriptional regulator with XRE-family HTH domain
MPTPKKHPLGRDSPLAMRMKRLREYHKCTQSEFARRLGISVARWYNIENGYAVRLDVAVALIRNTPGLTLDWIHFEKVDGLTVPLAVDLAPSAK